MRRLTMAQSTMLLFAKKIQLESKWNEMYLQNEGKITTDMLQLGDEIKKVIRSILKAQEEEAYNYANSTDLEIHQFAG
jgi:hypothetical protein